MQHPLWQSPGSDNFHDKAYRRDLLPAWDAGWEALPAEARRSFLTVFGPLYAIPSSRLPPLRAAAFPPEALAALAQAGFVTINTASVSPQGAEVRLTPEAGDFATRIHAVHRLHLLDPARKDSLSHYVNLAFAQYFLSQALGRVLDAAGVVHGEFFSNTILFVEHPSWPAWVASASKNPLAGKIVAVLDEVGPLPLADLTGRFPAYDRQWVRDCLEGLIRHLAVFEDTDRETFRLVVGLLPAVRAAREKARNPPPRPALVRREPEVAGQEGGSVVPALRVVLLELASGKARLRKGGTLYQKDQDRLTAALNVATGGAHQPNELAHLLQGALDFAALLNFTAPREERDAVWLELTTQGQEWLALGPSRQYAALYAGLREPTASSLGTYADRAFLGSDVTSIPRQPGSPAPLSYQIPAPNQQEREPLREALYRTLAELPAGEFVTLGSFLEWAVHGSHNPLLAGSPPEQVVVRHSGQMVPPLEDRLASAGRALLSDVVLNRLIPLGAVQGGLVAPRTILLARLPRLDLYFGKAEHEAEDTGPTRVVVQPDFTIVVIGLDPAPAAELVPFCERTQGSPGSGSLTLRLSRETVMRAIAAGLPPDEVLARLRKHSSGPLPGNVLHEVEDWCRKVRTIEPEPVLILRCPDAETADRVMAALGRKVERLGDTVVSWRDGTPAPADRRQLLQHGLILGETPPPEKRKKKRKKKR